jgi:membrane protein
MFALSPNSRRVETHLSDSAQPSDSHTGKPEVQGRLCGLRQLLTPGILFELLKATYFEWSMDKAPRMGAALAYYTIFSIAPLLIIAIAVASLVFGMQAAQGEISRQIQGLIGQEGSRTIQDLIQSAHQPAHSVIASLIGILALFFGASGVVSEMQDALNTIWHVGSNDESSIWKLVKGRCFCCGIVLGIGFLLLVSLLLSAVLALIADYLRDVLPVPALLLEGADFLFSLFFVTVLFAMIFKLLPRVSMAWSDVWVGAALTSLLFTMGKFVIGFYIGKSVSASAYGAAGSLVTVIAWIYYSALILYFGAEFTRVYANNIGSRRGAIRNLGHAM